MISITPDKPKLRVQGNVGESLHWDRGAKWDSGEKWDDNNRIEKIVVNIENKK